MRILADCPDCERTVNRTVNVRCPACGHEFLPQPDGGREVRTDGAGGYLWDDADCPHDECAGPLQQQDEYNVLCLECGDVFAHCMDHTYHRLVTNDSETVARKPRVMTDGGVSSPRSDTRCIKCDSRLPRDGGVEAAHAGADGSYCYECVSPPRIALVGCGSSKVDLEQGETIEARDLYSSNYFGLKREYAETCCDRWMILSAEHGLLSPFEEIPAYDASLKPSSDSYIGDYEAGKWAVQTSNEFQTYDSFQSVHARYVVLGGEDYIRHLDILEEDWRNVEFPFRSDDLGGIGDQMGWLRTQVDTHRPPGQANLENFAIATDGGKKTEGR